MRTAQYENREVMASEGAPREATCPACEGRVLLRRRRTRTGETWYYRHARGVAPDCPRRASPLE